MAIRREKGGAEDLVAVHEGAVARAEILDARPVVQGRDTDMAGRDELVLEQGGADRRVATELQRAGQWYLPACLGTLDDLERKFRHRSTLLVLRGCLSRSA